MFRAVTPAGGRPPDRGVLGRQPERVEPHRAHDRVAVPAPEVGDDLAEHVVADVPHVQLAGRIREHLEHVGLLRVTLGSSGPGFGLANASSSAQMRCHFSSIAFGSYRSITVSFDSGNKKASRERGLEETPRLSPRLLPGLRKKLLHEPKMVTGRIARCSSSSRTRRGSRRRARRSEASRTSTSPSGSGPARRLLRADDPRARRGAPRGGPRSAGPLRLEGVPERRRHAAPRRGGRRRGRRLARRARVRASGRDLPASGSSCTGTRSRTRSSARRPRPARRSSLDGEDEAERAARAGVGRVLVRVTLGVEADTHEAIRTGHHGSKFGLPPDARRVVARAPRARARRRSGCTSTSARSSRTRGRTRRRSPRSRRSPPAAATSSAGRRLLVDVGGGFAVRHVLEEPEAPLDELVRAVADAVERAWDDHGLPRPQLALEPGRALVGQAGTTLYRVRSVKRLDEVTWAAVDGGMSDNPRPQLYGARYTALSAARADEPATEVVSVAGLHCESGDVLIDDVALPPPRPGDLLAVPATGAYALAMSSNYNATPRPAAVLVEDGEARLIRRRETLDDLLAFEASSHLDLEPARRARSSEERARPTTGGDHGSNADARRSAACGRGGRGRERRVADDEGGAAQARRSGGAGARGARAGLPRATARRAPASSSWAPAWPASPAPTACGRRATWPRCTRRPTASGVAAGPSAASSRTARSTSTAAS